MQRPTFMLVRRAAAGAALAGAALAAAACGRGDNQSADRNGADTTSADTSATGPLGSPVGSAGPAADSAYRNAQGRLDSLQAAGVRADNGIDSVGSRVQAQTANEPGRDTSRLNNRATPDGVSPSGRRP